VTRKQDINDWFIKTAFPTRDEVTEVIHALEANADGLSVPELMTRVNLSSGRIDKTISLLSLESPAPIAKQGTKWQLTASILSDSFWERAERLTSLRKEEQRQMQEYVGLADGHMAFLINALDGDASMVGPSVLPELPVDVDAATVAAAITFLRRTSLPIEPRRKWPSFGMPEYDVKGKIPMEQQAQPGMALSIWGDAGWGGLVRSGKYRDGRFSDDLVAACVTMIRQWNPQPAPAWVTCVPSLRHPDLVPDFAQRLATALSIPFRVILKKIRSTPEQKTMANGTLQARNVDGSLALTDEPVRGDPVLLVDDMVDSRWTMTVAAWLLRSGGSGPVWPMALAEAGHDS
jgi:ATP-dependent DNA helicase RecQ